MKFENNKKALAGELVFIREVAKYFMDFLETDFHKRKLPKRNIKVRDGNNLLIGIDNGKYRSFEKKVAGLLQSGFDQSSLPTIEKGVYKADIPKNLLSLVQLQIEKIPAKTVTSLSKHITELVEQSGTLLAEEYDVAFVTLTERVTELIKTELVRPFVAQIEKPLLNLELGDENTTFLIEEELTTVLTAPLEDRLAEMLNRFIAKEKVSVEKEFKSSLRIGDLRQTIKTYFEALQVSDLYSELFEIDRNRALLDKQELYLYIGDISYGRLKYPLFYIPVSLSKREDAFDMSYDSQVYINKKALEFIVQEVNKETGGRGRVQSVTERILYLADVKERLLDELHSITNELSDFFELDGRIVLNDSEQRTAKGRYVKISNATHIALFDKSDEALVNDYEEILRLLAEGQEDSGLSEMFHELIADFIHENPEPVNPEVESDWDSLSISEKLVFPSPIPLNSEQRQILSALARKNCRYTIVQGPPGTGKSHTITAIAFDAVQNGRSVLVLSDKKEALDVVEDKITEVMNKVRPDERFQNPILRLGKTGNTYSKILAKASIEEIKAQFRATRQQADRLDESIEKSLNTLREDIQAEEIAYSNIDINEIHELYDLESKVAESGTCFDMDEAISQPDSTTDLVEFQGLLIKLRDKLSTPEAETLNVATNDALRKKLSLSKFAALLASFSVVGSVAESLRQQFSSQQLRNLGRLTSLHGTDSEELLSFYRSYQEHRLPVFGYLFSRAKIAELDSRFKQRFPSATIQIPSQEVAVLRDVISIISAVTNQSSEVEQKNIDLLFLIHEYFTNEAASRTVDLAAELNQDVRYLLELSEKYPKTSGVFGLETDNVSSLLNNSAHLVSEMDFNRCVRLVALKQKVDGDFAAVPDLNYAARKRSIEDMVTAKVTYSLDKRLIDFYTHSKNDAEILRKIIRSKQRFPRDQFAKLKDAFPCILAGIRDYAEYIPLESELFDLVIIDEASQVSIAQAFPAILRAKKVLILGDAKQFSNIKSAQARSDTNREYLSAIATSFRDNVSIDPTKLERMKRFNIKTSILEFFEYISNFNTQLLKHFRGYKEIISYSNKFFYQNSLQVMKIRGKAADDVLRFSYIEPEKAVETYSNTNLGEVEFIIEELHRLKEGDRADSVGIITPHTNQQKLLMERIATLPESDYYFEKLRLKIMTFDTCQGEERDIIYYSMVASRNSDKLWGVFIKNLADVDIEEGGQIKAQRLNVGFSRAKEQMHFVLSKPLDEFSGSIGEALRHYSHTLDEAKKERGVSEVDSKSVMEPEVMNWFYQTDFWRVNSNNAELHPQFEIGEYLRQLDRNYSHPAYKVDFLLLYTDERHRQHKIVIEYDGFQEHFRKIDEINEFNYSHYYNDEDVYRQKVLESYGYKFIRINKFNVGSNPVETLDKRLMTAIRNGASVSNTIINDIQNTARGLQENKMKECPKCKTIRELSEFADSSLITGYGRICNVCKGLAKAGDESASGARNVSVAGDLPCPLCQSKMFLRNGRFGKFYGCSRFPYCRGTRKIS